MERWQMKEKIRELSAHQSVHQAEGAPSAPRRVEDGLGKIKVLGVRSLSLVSKPRKAKRLRRRSEWSVPSSPEPMAIVKGPLKRLLAPTSSKEAIVWPGETHLQLALRRQSWVISGSAPT
ncbi:hypothetical protein KXW29_006889, partial [Aspergillus fumigatus]